MKVNVDNFVKKLDTIIDNIGEGYLDVITSLEYLDEISDLVTDMRKRIEKKSEEKEKVKRTITKSKSFMDEQPTLMGQTKQGKRTYHGRVDQYDRGFNNNERTKEYQTYGKARNEDRMIKGQLQGKKIDKYGYKVDNFIAESESELSESGSESELNESGSESDYDGGKKTVKKIKNKSNTKSNKSKKIKTVKKSKKNTRKKK